MLILTSEHLDPTDMPVDVFGQGFRGDYVNSQPKRTCSTL